MTAITAPSPATNATQTFWPATFSFARGALLGAAAGGTAGMLVGGIGGRLAMLILRLTSPDSISGIESDDGFEMGVVSLATFNLIAVTGLLGVVAGLFVALATRFMRTAWMPWVWAAPGATLGGAGLIHADGVDFNLLGPLWLAVVLFAAIPAFGLVAMAWLIRRWQRWWWTDRLRTSLALAAAWPLVVLFPIAVALAILALVWGLLARQEAIQELVKTRFATRAAEAAFVVVTLIFLPVLVNDVLDVL